MWWHGVLRYSHSAEPRARFEELVGQVEALIAQSWYSHSNFVLPQIRASGVPSPTFTDLFRIMCASCFSNRPYGKVDLLMHPTPARLATAVVSFAAAVCALLLTLHPIALDECRINPAFDEGGVIEDFLMERNCRFDSVHGELSQRSPHDS